ncbi:hypothetical protein B0T18DRAFT_3087 [Schizothecium vesticola]|uniref:Uncharacterized protein n=1 Tax=Schizothecium vesticola TaxID=314040 RepID=A0AA40F816_9PEZI|nr:hypothetical protein B0T18DRAFT_3087 [Schizothecium vesticola]
MGLRRSLTLSIFAIQPTTFQVYEGKRLWFHNHDAATIRTFFIWWSETCYLRIHVHKYNHSWLIVSATSTAKLEHSNKNSLRGGGSESSGRHSGCQ